MILEHEGIEQSHKAWAADYGIPPSLIVARLDCGWPIAAAIETPMEAPPGFKLGDPVAPLQKKRPRKGRRYDHDGRSLTIAEWADVAGLPVSVMSARINTGWTIARAITTPARSADHAARYSFDGKCLTLAEWSRLSGLSTNTLRSRLRMGWPLGRALTEEAQLSGKGERTKGGGYQATFAVPKEDRRPRHAQDCA